MSKRWSRWAPVFASSAVLGVLGYSIGCGGDDENAGAPSAADASPSDSSNPSTQDGASQQDSATDAPINPGLPCDVTKPFGPLVAVAALNTGATQSGARLSTDQKTVYFAQDGNLKRATRDSVTADFGSPIDIDVAPVPGSSPTPSADGNTLYFERNSGGVKVFWATAADGGFQVQGAVPTIADPQNTGQPFVRGDGTMIYFASRSATTDAGIPFGGLDLYRAPIVSAGQTSQWQQVRSVGTTGDEGYPVVSSNGDRLYYARNETSSMDASVYQIHAAAFDVADGGYGAGAEDALVTGLNDGIHFFRPTWIAPDGCTIWVTSNRDADGGASESKIFTATRPK